MFTLVFLVMFGPKKGSIIAYISSWDFHFNNHNYTTSLNTKTLSQNLSHRFQFTVVTSRLTSYFLLSFWLFFFFYGETLLLVVFNYSTPVDTITSSAFFTIKQHVIFLLTTTPHKLITYINFYIFLLTSCAFCYIMNLNYSYNYNYFRNSTLNSGLVYVVVLIMLFF